MDHLLIKLLRDHQLRYTLPRKHVFDALKVRGALTTRELGAATTGLLDTASLYRALTLFRELGVIKDVVIAGQRKVELTDRFTGHHHHIACSRCGVVLAIHDHEFERRIETLASTYGYTHETHSFEITGICASCHASAMAEPSRPTE